MIIEMSAPTPNFLSLAPIHGKPAIPKDIAISTQITEPSTPLKVKTNDKTKFLPLTPESKSSNTTTQSSTASSPPEYANSSPDEEENFPVSDQATPAMTTDEESSTFSADGADSTSTEIDSDDSESFEEKEREGAENGDDGKEKVGPGKGMAGSYVPDGVVEGVMQV
jgi:hypothetical protein